MLSWLACRYRNSHCCNMWATCCSTCLLPLVKGHVMSARQSFHWLSGMSVRQFTWNSVCCSTCASTYKHLPTSSKQQLLRLTYSFQLLSQQRQDGCFSNRGICLLRHLELLTDQNQNCNKHCNIQTKTNNVLIVYHTTSGTTNVTKLITQDLL